MNNFLSVESYPNFQTNIFNLNSNIFKSFPLKILEINGFDALLLAGCDISGEIEFEPPSTLAALDISNNFITSLGPRFINSLENLSTLQIYHNQITAIADSFPENSML